MSQPVIRIENYTDKYRDDLVKVVQNFHDESLKEYDGVCDVETLHNIIDAAKPEDLFLLTVDGKCQGVLYGTTIESHLNQKQIFQEVIWYVNPEHRRSGINLLREVEKILKHRNISIIIMVCLKNSMYEKLCGFYERMGYKALETHFMRNL